MFVLVRDSRFQLVPEEFLKQPDIAIYGLSILFVGMFLFLPFFNLLHPSPWHRWMGTIYLGLTHTLRILGVLGALAVR